MSEEVSALVTHPRLASVDLHLALVGAGAAVPQELDLDRSASDLRDLRADVTELSAAREIDVRVRGRGYRAVLTPDLEAGGY